MIARIAAAALNIEAIAAEYGRYRTYRLNIDS